MQELAHYFHLFFDSSDHFYAIFDAKDQLKFFNGNAELLAPEGFISSRFFTEDLLGNAENLAAIQDLFKTVRDVQKGTSVEIALKKPGHDRYLKFQLKPLEGFEESDYLLLRVSDETERKLMEMNWKDQEEQFLAVTNFSDVGVILTDAKRNTIYINQPLFESLGYSEHEIMELSFEEITHPDDVEEETVLFEELIKSKRDSYRLEKRIKRKDGKWIWVKLTATALHNNDGSIKYLLFAVNDISRIKQVEQDLRESKRNYQTLVEQSPMGIIVHQDQKVVYANQQALRIMKAREPGDFLGKNPIHFVHPDSLEKVQERISKLFAEKGFAPINEEKYIDLEGKEVIVEATGNYILFNGKPASQVSFIEISDVKRAEQHVKKEKEKAELYLNTASSIIAVIDKNGIIERINQKGQKVLGFSAAELEGENWFDKCVSPKFRERYRKTFADYIEKDDTGNYLEGVVLTSEGVKRLIGWYAHLLKDANGNVNKVVLSGQDITEERHNQHLLKKSEQSLKEAQSIARLGSWEWSLETGRVKISEEIKKILELGKLESDFVSPRDLFQFLVSDAKRDFKIDYEKALKGIAFDKFEYKVKTSKGHDKYIEGRISKVKNDDGKVIGYKGTLQDITERKKMLNQLSRSEKKYRTLFERNLVGVFRLHLESEVVVDCNQAFAKLIKVGSKKEIIGRKISDYMKILNERYYLERVATQGQLTNNESHIQLHTGAEIFTMENCYLVEESDGEKYIEGTVQDITKNKKAELERIKLIDQLTAQNKDLEEFAYVVSHNLRSPVASILGLTNLANTAIHTDDQSREILNRLSDTASDLDEIIKDLNFILSSRKGGTDPKENLVMEEMVNITSRVLKSEITKTKALIKSDFSKAPEIFAVKSYMSNIFYNLIHNAIKYRKNEVRPEIDIFSYHENGSIVIQVSDNGIGMDMERAKNKLFGLYQRIHTHTDGKGMGLYLVKSQIESMGGKIEVDSEINKGTTFLVRLPSARTEGK